MLLNTHYSKIVSLGVWRSVSSAPSFSRRLRAPQKDDLPDKDRDLLFLVFEDFLSFSDLQEFLVLLRIVPSFSRIVSEKSFWWSFKNLLFPKEQGKENEGTSYFSVTVARFWFIQSMLLADHPAPLFLCLLVGNYRQRNPCFPFRTHLGNQCLIWKFLNYLDRPSNPANITSHCLWQFTGIAFSAHKTPRSPFPSLFVTIWKHPKGTRQKGTGREVQF